MEIFTFLKGAGAFLQKHGRDGLDAFVVVALVGAFGKLATSGANQYLSAAVIVTALYGYLWQRNRSDYHKERMAQIDVDQIEKKRGPSARSKARKRLEKPNRDVTEVQPKVLSDDT